MLAVFSRTGNCYFIRDDIVGTTTYGVLAAAPVADCRADYVGAVALGASW